MNPFTLIGYCAVAAFVASAVGAFIMLARDIGIKAALLSPLWIVAMLLRRR